MMTDFFIFFVVFLPIVSGISSVLMNSGVHIVRRKRKANNNELSVTYSKLYIVRNNVSVSISFKRMKS